MPAGDDEAFCAEAAGALARLPGIRAVALGGSWAAGTARPDSDWDFAVYYRGSFDPASLGTLGWPGEIFPIGGWGGGVFNGGAWLRAGDRRVDVHYRDLEDVEYHLAEARAGRFRIERLLFHLAGTAGAIATAACQVAHGVLAARGEWITNEKTLLDQAGLRGADGILAGLYPEPGRLVRAVDAAGGLLRAALGEASGTGPLAPGS